MRVTGLSHIYNTVYCTLFMKYLYHVCVRHRQYQVPVTGAILAGNGTS